MNLRLLTGQACHALMFDPQAVHQGEWWRVLTHPFIHVTWYHLLLDGSAFFLLYPSLLESSVCKRLAYVCGGASGSLLFAWCSASAASGLCGLSGIAHGLMAVSAIEMIASSKDGTPERRVGLATLLFLVAKVCFEALTGRMFFAFLDFGMLGSPVAVSHLGGVVGALLVFAIVRPQIKHRHYKSLSAAASAPRRRLQTAYQGSSFRKGE